MTSQQSLAPLPQRVETILAQLTEAHPQATYELDWDTPLQLLIGTILAAQCTDERVNRVTKTLFPKYPNAEAFAAADILALEEDLKPTGFYRKKAQAVQSMCQQLVERFGGEVPPTMEQLITLPGVARKTANVVLNCAFKIPSGIIVDTHVARVSQRIGLSSHKNPDKIEQDLMKLVPEEQWTWFGPAVVLHGRYTCVASNPQCSECILRDVCEQKI